MVLEDQAEATRRSATVLARVVQALEWRDAPEDALGRLQGPREVQGAEVVLARDDDELEAWLARTAWSGARRLSCAAAFGESDGLGGVALAVAAARVASGLAADVLVAGLDDRRGYFVVLAAP